MTANADEVRQEAGVKVMPADQMRLRVDIYHNRRWTLEEIRFQDFDPASPEPPITLFDVPLGSKVFGQGDSGPWERVLLRKEPTS